MKYLLLPLLLLFCSWHSVATTQLEMEVDQESGALEIALHLSPNDLETCLTQWNGRAIRLDKEENIDELITVYLQAHLSILNAEQEAASFTWVGKDIKLRDAWVYFQLEVDGSLEGKQLHNDLLTGLHHDYVSTVSLRLPKQKMRSLRFDRETTAQDLLKD
ncbi:MAG: hypothetical protein COA70_09760 [Planctomycetota bacterium]|nr:MAG: hypothetical protein COA70_09760 [Planctomycetota bacterium]